MAVAFLQRAMQNECVIGCSAGIKMYMMLADLENARMPGIMLEILTKSDTPLRSKNLVNFFLRSH